jgi:hypothetical protein
MPKDPLRLALRLKQKEVTQEKVLSKLYELPLDIKIKIFHMAIASHMISWKQSHEEDNEESVEDIGSEWSLEYDTMRMRWMWIMRWFGPTDRDPFSDFDWSFSTLCYKNFHLQDYKGRGGKLFWFGYCKTKKQYDELEGVKQYPIEYNPHDHAYIEGRQVYDKPGYFWCHEKCRCKRCDFVRFAHRETMRKTTQLDPHINMKYARVTWDIVTSWDPSSGYPHESWGTKTVSQMKSIRDKARRGYRNDRNDLKVVS